MSRSRLHLDRKALPFNQPSSIMDRPPKTVLTHQIKGKLACYQWKIVKAIEPLLAWFQPQQMVKTNSTPITQAILPTGQAYHLNQAVVGIAHRQPKHALPCQDSSISTITPRPILIVCDGAGSSAVSDIGSQTLCTQLTRLIQSLEPILPDYLDVIQHKDALALVRMIIRHAIGTLQDLNNSHRRAIKDFRSTLNLVVIGKVHTLWLKVGDGEILQQTMHQMPNISYNEQSSCITYNFMGIAHKGEFANQTQFIDDSLTLAEVQWGLLSSTQTTAFALMSDGVTEKFVNHQRNQVANKLTQWLELLRQDNLKVTDIYQTFYSKEFLYQTTGDDRGIALYSRALH